MKTSIATSRCALLVIALAFVVGGCSAVYVRTPVGETAHVLQPNEWAGTWLTPDGKALVVSVPDPGKGVLQIVGLEGNEHDLQVKKYTIAVTESAGWLFANVRDDARPDASRHIWGRLKRDEDMVIIWPPDVRAFKALVRDGKVKGKELDSGDVELEFIAPETMLAFATGELGVPFGWDTPFILRRVGR
ncbi:MAG TPA: hypothetical protein VM029_11895 [Opitutaceae bacterium]|nr:hypothetical protein [Opitutaceae bacterium]